MPMVSEYINKLVAGDFSIKPQFRIPIPLKTHRLDELTYVKICRVAKSSHRSVRDHFGSGSLEGLETRILAILVSSGPSGFFQKFVEKPTNFTFYDASGYLTGTFRHIYK
ncbi:hypothetical protein TNCV_4130321 [Trichonephila clavipes]|nr:hypothetical protein TNCV_4130321 [Trichonephila clavipes]